MVGRVDKKNAPVRILEVLTGSCVVLMLAVTAGGASSRYLFGLAPPWCEEAARFFFIYQIFLGAALAVVRRENLKADFLTSVFPPRIRRILDLFLRSLSIVFLSVVVAYSVPLLRKVYVYPLPAMQFSTSYLYLAVPIGCFLMLLFALKELLMELRAGRRAG